MFWYSTAVHGQDSASEVDIKTGIEDKDGACFSPNCNDGIGVTSSGAERKIRSLKTMTVLWCAVEV